MYILDCKLHISELYKRGYIFSPNKQGLAEF